MQNFALTYLPSLEKARTMNLALIFAHHPRCPKCGSLAIHRSRRKGLMESVLRWVLYIAPYRCKECNYRHFRLSFHTSRHPSTNAIR
jgi:predicted Zn-ribbon and HTH transcriptional regulator